MSTIKRACISPFQNESEVVTLGNTLTIENRLDRVQIYGQIDLTKDKEGYQYALDLKRQIDSIINVLETEDLPDKVSLCKLQKFIKSPL